MAEVKGEFTFEYIAREWHANNKRWSVSTKARILSNLERYVFPYIGSIDIRQLKTRQLLTVVRNVNEDGKYDVAQRLQQRIAAIMRHAVQHEIIENNPALDMAGAFSTPKSVHHPALSPTRIPEFLSRLSCYKGRKITLLAVELNHRYLHKVMKIWYF